ncbi:MAG: acetate--CoA ligase family protein [Myxococcales bacterium]|nr:acetate--CoA ligase family protein [Myxococcales bacterium]
MTPWTVLCDEPSLAVELARHAAEIGVSLRPVLLDEPSGERNAVAALRPLDPAALARLAASPSRPAALATLGDGAEATAQIASELGIPTVCELRPFVSLLALLSAPASPLEASPRGLEPVDRQRLVRFTGARRATTHFEPLDHGRVAFAGPWGLVDVGEARDLALALAALDAARHDARPSMPRVAGIQRQSVLDVIFGPARELSDPASKSALANYDVPLPLEEVCASPSRAAAEATRIGFPVRVALASPDLRGWEHRDLVAERVESASRVRDVFRQVMSLAQERAPQARLLGVTVSATSETRALLRVDARLLREGLALARIAFADPHGEACGDATHVVLPCTHAGLERALGRLRGAALLLAGGAVERRAVVTSVGDTLLRVAAFLNDWPEEVDRIRLQPLAMLVDGRVEIREASVAVTDAFERNLIAAR